MNQNSITNIIPGIYTLHKPTECYHKLDNKPIHRQPKNATEGKQTIKVVSNNSVRKLIIPERQPVFSPEIWSKENLNRIKKQSQIITTKDRMAMIEEANKEKMKQTIECENRKEALRKAQSNKRKGKHLNDVELAEYKRNTYLLKRAVELQRENEIEVQEANRLILATKCQAIRDAQLVEKQLIEKELKEEENRLQEMEEQKSAQEYEKELKRREEEKQKQKSFVADIIQQVKEHEVQQLFDLERKDEEARMRNRMLLQMQREADEKQQMKIDMNRKTMAEAKAINEQLLKFQLIQKEEQRIEDLRIQEFLRKKAERDALIAEEHRMAQEAKDKEKQRLYELQARALSLQTSGDELKAIRIQEEVERKWRAAEKEAARKRAENTEKLKKDRENQVMDLKRMQALDMEREKIEFFKNISVQKQMYEREVEERNKRREASKKYKEDLIKQINDKEKEKIEEKKRKFEDGEALKLQQESKADEIKTYIKDKVTKLRDVNFVPLNLIKDIERQLKI